MECYVRAMDADDTFHGEHGMLRPLIVTEESSDMAPPEADIEITLSNYDLKVEGELTAGDRVARVRVEEDPEGLIFHNVHLVRLEGETTGDTVASWMNWVDSMVPPAPGPVRTPPPRPAWVSGNGRSARRRRHCRCSCRHWS